MYLELVLVVVVSFTVINHIEAAAAESEDILDCSSSILLPKYSAAVNKMDFFYFLKPTLIGKTENYVLSLSQFCFVTAQLLKDQF